LKRGGGRARIQKRKERPRAAINMQESESSDHFRKPEGGEKAHDPDPKKKKKP